MDYSSVYLGISAVVALIVTIIAGIILLRDKASSRHGTVGRFFNFESFSIGTLVKIAYMFLAVLIFVYSIFDFVDGITIVITYGTSYIIYGLYYCGEGLLILFGGEIILRIVAELIVILVRQAEDISALREDMEYDEDEDEEDEDEDEEEDEDDEVEGAPLPPVVDEDEEEESDDEEDEDESDDEDGEEAEEDAEESDEDAEADDEDESEEDDAEEPEAEDVVIGEVEATAEADDVVEPEADATEAESEATEEPASAE